MESLTAEAGAPAAVPEDRCRPPPQASGALLDEAEAAAAPYPCGYCGAFHGSETGYCAACSRSWLKPEIAAGRAVPARVPRTRDDDDELLRNGRQGRALGVLRLDRARRVLLVPHQKRRGAGARWMAPSSSYPWRRCTVPTMRRMVVLIEDVDEIGALFERTWREHENDEKKGPAPAESLAR